MLLASVASADSLNDELEDAGRDFTGKLRAGQTVFHYNTSTVSLSQAVDVQACKGGLDVWFNPDFDGTNVTATYTLFSCPRATLAGLYASECLPLNFDPDGGGADTNVMSDATDSLHIWHARIRFFGATITSSGDEAQATIRCL